MNDQFSSQMAVSEAMKSRGDQEWFGMGAD
jgi:hypothetical protein